MSTPTVKVKLTARWGEYGPGRELNLPDWLAEKLLAANICSRAEPELPLARETAEAPRAETAAIAGRPAPNRKKAPIAAAPRPETAP